MRIDCRHLSKVYHTRQGEISALEDASLSAEGHEFVCIVGPSGCGKTTLLKLMAGLLEPTSGEIVGEAGPASDRPLNAMVFQEHGLFPCVRTRDAGGATHRTPQACGQVR
jgi:NitT/TauT family transport system ATP-binding protein